MPECLRLGVVKRAAVAGDDVVDLADHAIGDLLRLVFRHALATTGVGKLDEDLMALFAVSVLDLRNEILGDGERRDCLREGGAHRFAHRPAHMLRAEIA